jgi:D-serine deaminase-like pyridoxal phosphate-dependent protein
VEIGVIVEVNTGMDRCGTALGEETVALSKLIDSLSGLRYDGMMGYEGHVVANRDYEERKTEATRSANSLVETAEQVRAAGLDVKIVSAAGTGTYNITGLVKGITDLQCGSYIFMDGDYLEVFDDFDPALSVLTTVISVQDGYVVTDTGKKSISEDRGYPIVIEPSGGTVISLSEEHCKIEVSGEASKLKLGDQVRLRPMHGDTTINMHSHYFLVRQGVLESALEIAGRGRVR